MEEEILYCSWCSKPIIPPEKARKLYQMYFHPDHYIEYVGAERIVSEVIDPQPPQATP